MGNVSYREFTLNKFYLSKLIYPSFYRSGLCYYFLFRLYDWLTSFRCLSIIVCKCSNDVKSKKLSPTNIVLFVCQCVEQKDDPRVFRLPCELQHLIHLAILNIVEYGVY